MMARKEGQSRKKNKKENISESQIIRANILDLSVSCVRGQNLYRILCTSLILLS